MEQINSYGVILYTYDTKPSTTVLSNHPYVPIELDCVKKKIIARHSLVLYSQNSSKGNHLIFIQ